VRAVNLIPSEQRRGTRGGGAVRVGLATRVLLGVLGVAVVAVTALVLISNQVSEKQTELVEVARKQEVAAAAGNALRPYGNFVKLEQERHATVTALAQSRFNWERVMRQLSRVTPDGVWITEMKGTVSTGAGAQGTAAGGAGGGGGGLRNGIQGPAMELKGCSRSQEGSARTITRMRNLDEVTSVTLTKSGLPEDEGPAGAAQSAQDDTGCPKKVYTFELIAGFKVPAASIPAAAVPTVGGAQTQTAATPPTGSTTGSTGGQGAGQ
jgi:Tfp pilus assembly protein PilN